ncbi:MAG: AAA family ATPase [Thermodesulfobacteriota bacterium]
MFDPEIGFTSDVIKEPERFVGRADLLRDALRALNSKHGLIAIYGKRGVGKSSLVRQLQQLALGDYQLLQKAGLYHLVPQSPRTYLTVYYQCDSAIQNAEGLLNRLINDQDDEDGLLRLVPNEGKELVEFTRTKSVNAGCDLKVVNWGVEGIEASKYVRTAGNDVTQTFRNFVTATVAHQVKNRSKRDGLLIMLDEFDVIQDKSNIGSLIKSLSSETVKFCISGIAHDIAALVQDHQSVQRLLEEGSLLVKPMPTAEATGIIERAEALYQKQLVFEDGVKKSIAAVSAGYPYFVQLLGKACVQKANELGQNVITSEIWESLLNEVKEGVAFPPLEGKYQRAIGNSDQRRILLHLLAEQPEEAAGITEESGRVRLKETRGVAQEFQITNVGQLIPRLLDRNYGPVLEKVRDRDGVYEFVDPVFRLYVRLRTLD